MPAMSILTFRDFVAIDANVCCSLEIDLCSGVELIPLT
ncbi:hypothetical protein SynPROS91_02181 [Synechococcus sp. PROS-9-1]|nr:hypothetical protein SynPROS91_02181 [Synechococcus sp. PROS-9-1]